MKIFLSPWMRELDELTIDKIGVPSIVLMERAALGAVSFICDEFPQEKYPRCLVLVGKGNNGGDGLAVGRMLHQRGYEVRLLLLFSESEIKGDARINLRIAQNLGIACLRVDSLPRLKRVMQAMAENTLIVDALFGTGLTRPIQEGLIGNVIRFVNSLGFPVAALDVPSGISDSFLPEEGIHIRSSITATFGGLKWSLLHPDGNEACGKIRVVDIGIPRQLMQSSRYFLELIEPSGFLDLLHPRSANAHKGKFGHVLSIAGSLDKPGAGLLSAFSALRSGAGLVTAAVVEANRVFYIKAHPELMTLPYSSPREIISRIHDFNCILAGPGLGNNASTADLVEALLIESQSALVLDADGLNVLKDRLSLLKRKRSFPLVLTPHLGEFSRLTGLGIREIQKDRIGIGREFAKHYRVYLVLKGHHTLIATPRGYVYVNQTGNPGMAKAGSGDVLGGMVAGLIAQFVGQREMEVVLSAAIFLHGLAGDIAERLKGERTLVATDIVEAIPLSFQEVHGFRSPFQFS